MLMHPVEEKKKKKSESSSKGFALVLPSYNAGIRLIFTFVTSPLKLDN